METGSIKTAAAGCTNINHPPGQQASSQLTLTTSTSCDEDVLIQILLCLPVMSLLRFKSVCKSWLSIIETPFFIHLHASNLGGGGGGSSLLLFREGEEEEKKKRGNFFMLSGEKFQVFRNLDRPTSLVGLSDEEFEGMKFCVKGCCNGIICLHDLYTRNVVLWNPAIKQSRLVPKPSNVLGNPNCFVDYSVGICFAEDVIAFGVDIKTKDYKVLLITILQPREWSDYEYADDDDEERFMPMQRRVHVYSSSTDSWRCIDDADDTLSAADPNLLQLDSDLIKESVCLNGSYFFIAYQQREDEDEECVPLIMSFDFTEEIFRTIQPPYDWNNYHTMNSTINSKVYFIPFNEKIALVDVKSDGFFYRMDRLECDVWLLNDLHNGVKEESWTKFYTFGHSYGSYRSPIQFDLALRCIANNRQLIMNNRQLIIHCSDRAQHVWQSQLFNFITGETKDLLSGVDLNVIIYKPSLVKIGRSGASISTNEKCK